MVDECLTVYGAVKLSSKVAVLFCVPPAMYCYKCSWALAVAGFSKFRPSKVPSGTLLWFYT